MSDYAGRRAVPNEPPGPGPSPAATSPGKRTLVDQIVVPPAPVQQRASAEAAPHDPASVHAAAAHGVATPSSRLPHAEMVQRLFGRHDVSQIQAHTGPEAATSARAMGAQAYATGNHVVLGDRADLHTVAHEAAHVVQQRGGVQLKGGVGAAGDAHERHADAVADRVVAGQSAEALLDGVAGGRSEIGGAGSAVQRKDDPGDTAILADQAKLKNTDVEIPALEGALLATRQEAMKRGLLSRASFDAGLALSRAMTQLQPAAAAKGAVDKAVQNAAANAAQQLFAALQHETADDKNFKVQPSTTEAPVITEVNPYTDETRITTYFFAWITSQSTFSGFQRLPESIRQGNWDDAFRGYRGLVDGLDLWVADQLRKTGKGSKDEALGNAQVYRAQMLTGLEQIAGKHAKRVPALFHPAPKIVESERAAGRPATDTVPMNVYFWKDDQDGKFHLYDLTTPGRPQEQKVDREPTAALLGTFFEEVARYPEGAVHYTLPGGAAGVAQTTGKTKWYEWAGYAGLLLAGAGLALFTGGASFAVAANVCLAAGAIAGGVSAAGHLADSAQLGTATTATVVLDVAQIAASFASFGALSITVKAGGAAAALAGSRAFVPLVSAAAAADSVQLVALTSITVDEMTRIQNNPAGSPEDKQRAIAVLLTQLAVTGALTVLSVRGARSARGLSGQPLELVDQSAGPPVLRVTGEHTPAPVAHPEQPATGPAPTATAKVEGGTSAEPEAASRFGEHDHGTTTELATPKVAADGLGGDPQADALAKDRADLRWQMNDKNRRLTAAGEPPRYTDLDSEVNAGMKNAAVARDRGYPYGFKDKAQFVAMAAKLKGDIGALPAPPGGIAIPTTEIVVQGSAVHRPTAADVDLAVLVSPTDFAKLIEQSFPKECLRVRARGLDPLMLTEATATNAAERTLGRAVESGKINRNIANPKLSDARDAAAAAAGVKVDLSIIKKGGPFDHGPYLPLP